MSIFLKKIQNDEEKKKCYLSIKMLCFLLFLFDLRNRKCTEIKRR